MTGAATAFPCLTTRSFRAFIADNSAMGVHRAGYNGVASLIPARTGKNILVPSAGALNYEIIAMKGLGPYAPTAVSPFEPRSEPMRIARADAEQVTLMQPKTSHSHVGARITFRAEEPHYLHQRIELTFHRRFCRADEANAFHSLWASYIHAPADRHVYVKPDGERGGDLAGWTGITKVDHGPADWHIRALPGDRELTPAEHVEAMRDGPPEVFPFGPVPATDPLTLGREVLPGPLTFYYGLVDDLLFLMMFRQPERFRLAYSPCGGGREPAWSPAWDYVLRLADAPLDRPCVWDLCLAVKPYRGRKDVVEEVRRYLNA
jgi:hypothetical protein